MVESRSAIRCFCLASFCSKAAFSLLCCRTASVSRLITSRGSFAIAGPSNFQSAARLPCTIRADDEAGLLVPGRNLRNQPRLLHELPAILIRFVLDGVVVAQIPRREALHAPFLELHDVLELVGPELRVLERCSALFEHDDVVERDRGGVTEADHVLRQRELAAPFAPANAVENGIRNVTL